MSEYASRNWGLDLVRVTEAGHIVVGEEGKFGVHSALESGRMVGTGAGPAMDVVVDPIDGRNLLTGMRYHGERAETHSLILRADTGSRRVMYAEHVST